MTPEDLAKELARRVLQPSPERELRIWYNKLIQSWRDNRVFFSEQVKQVGTRQAAVLWMMLEDWMDEAEPELDGLWAEIESYMRKHPKALDPLLKMPPLDDEKGK